MLLSVTFCQIIFSVFLSKMYYTSLKKSQIETLFYELKRNYSDAESIIQQTTQYAENARNINIEVFSTGGLVYWSRGYGILLSDIDLSAYTDKPKAEIAFNPEILIRPPAQYFSGMQLKPPPPDFREMPPRAPMPPPPNKNAEHIVLTGKFTYDDDIRYVRIMTFIESIDESVRALAAVNIFISGFILIIGIIYAFLFARNFSKPIQNIQNVARNVAVLSFEARANENLNTLELRDLSKSINVMAEKLSCLISDLRASNEKLQTDIDYQMRLDKMRREFVANVSHELKTPLHLLIMYAENLKNNIDGIDKDYYCKTIIDETNRMNEMVKNLLNLSEMENKLVKMNREKLNLSDFCEYLISKTALLLENLTVCHSIEKEIFVEGDSSFIEQAANNYIINAVSHTPAAGHIYIELKLSGDEAVFSVLNEGDPIDDEDIPHIWESFYKTDKARIRTDENSTGLGLSIVKTIIEAHGGKYGVRNAENLVEFWFSLPTERKISKN